MSQEMSCPVCGDGNVRGNATQGYWCSNQECPSYAETDTKTYNTLIKTNSMLGICLLTLNLIIDACINPNTPPSHKVQWIEKCALSAIDDVARLTKQENE